MIESDRGRSRSRSANTAIADIELRQRLREYALLSPSELDARLAHLEAEWDVDRALEANAAVIALMGTAFIATRSSAWSWLAATVLGYLLQHAVQGWCPALAMLRHEGYRTRKEIDDEKYGLKLLRGDFQNFPAVAEAPPATRAYRAWQALRTA